MKTIKTFVISGLAFFLILGMLPSCKRTDSKQPDPMGPSSLGILLNITSSVNALFAGTQRESSTISATLRSYDGSPIAGKTVHFQVGDACGNRLPIGFFDNAATVASKITDGSGNVSVGYFGPLSEEAFEINDVHIWATVAWEGSQSIQASTPIQIVRDLTALFIAVSASPNVLFAGKNRDTSTVTAVVTITGGIPLAGRTVFFEIVSLNENQEDLERPIPLGYFDNNQAVAKKVIGADGSVRVNYYGPLASELMGENHLVGIKATVSLDGTYQEGFQSETAQIQVIADATALTTDIGAEPDVLSATNIRPRSVIKFIARYEGAPIANRRVYFTIVSGPGHFTGNKRLTYALTGTDGVATVTYFGPTRNEIAFSQWVSIRGHLETSFPDQYESHVSYKVVDIYIIRN